MRFAAAISEHPVTAHATGEVIGQALESVGPQPDVAFLFVTPPHAGALEDVAAAVRSTLAPGTLVGCAAVAVVGPGVEVEESAAVALWAATGVRAHPLALGTDDDGELSGWTEPPFEPDCLVLVADPFSFDAAAAFARLEGIRPGLPVLGGNASAARGPGGNRLALDGAVTTAGAVGVALGGVGLTSVVSQGCRPVGRPWVVTRSERNIVYELAGRPAMERLVAMARESLDDSEIAVVNRGGLHLGRVVDEHRAEFDRGDFLVRNVLGADPDVGAIAVGDTVEVGTTVQFHLRDAATADEDLRALLADASADAALLFTCNGRGRRLFGVADHDAAVLALALDDAPVCGFFAAGEFGPVGGRNFVHGFTASIGLFRTS